MPCCIPIGGDRIPRLLHDSGAEPHVFVIGNRARVLQLFELLDLVGGADADELAEIVASLRPSRHALAVVPPVSHEITDCIR